MPYVNVQITKESETRPEMKARVIRGITDVLAEVLGKDPASTFIVIDEVDTDNWGFRGESVTTLRSREE